MKCSFFSKARREGGGRLVNWLWPFSDVGEVSSGKKPCMMLPEIKQRFYISAELGELYGMISL